jgi:hypothetical protein
MEWLDYDAVEAVEAQLDQFILKRNRERGDANKVEELWRASEARHRERRREENLVAWRSFHAYMQALHAGLAAEHEAKAKGLLEEPGEGELS